MNLVEGMFRFARALSLRGVLRGLFKHFKEWREEKLNGNCSELKSPCKAWK